MSKRRIGVMGGTFDPIHNGHLICAEQAACELGLDEVLFVPTATPSFKRDQHVTPASDRLAMCRLAVAGNARFSVDEIEVARGGVSYTAETLAELSERYGDDVELFFVTGTDAAATLPKWKDHERILGIATVAAIARPGYELPDELLAMGVRAVACNALDVSSSEVRERVSAGKTVRYLVPDAVLGYIEGRGLYGAPQSTCPDEPEKSAGELEDPLDDAFFAAREADLQGRVSEKRLRHIHGVAETAARLARTYGVDERMARLAGLLHDWDKGYDDAGIRERAAQLGMDIDPLVVAHMPQTLHGLTAAEALHREFPQIPAEVIQAIARHTVGAADMSPLDMVVYIADALEPNRRFDDVDEMRALIGEVTLEELFVTVLGYWTAIILQRRATVHPDTIDVWNAYAIRRKAGRDYRAGDGGRRG